MRRPWLRDWSCGATRQRCKLASPKNIVDLPGRPSTSSDRSISLEASSDDGHGALTQRPTSSSGVGRCLAVTRTWRPSRLRAPGHR
jgi:hypothetical protein